MLVEKDIVTFVEKMRRALAGVDEFPEHWTRPHNRRSGWPQEPPHCGAELQQTYEEATGTLIACD